MSVRAFATRSQEEGQASELASSAPPRVRACERQPDGKRRTRGGNDKTKSTTTGMIQDHLRARAEERVSPRRSRLPMPNLGVRTHL